VLGELLEAHRMTDFARDHGLDRVRTPEDFRVAVPIRTYDRLAPYMSRVFEGQTTALLPPGEKVLMFSLTSGTTGKPKHIPVTQRFLDATRRGSNVWGVGVFRDYPAGWLRRIMRISSPMCEFVSPTGIPCGAISGLLMRNQKKIVRRMYVTPEAASSIPDPAVKYYTLLRCGIDKDVAIIITANPSSTIAMVESAQRHAERLIRDVADGTLNPPGDLPRDVAGALEFSPNRKLARRIQEGVDSDGRLLPRHFWDPCLLANWTGGTLKLYMKRLGELFGDVPVRDVGLLASEGRFSVPLRSGTPEGVAEILGNFLEFMPADQRQSDSPETLFAHELDVGAEYFLVVTNWAGLWRYDLDDRVRVTGHVGQSPVFEFLSRGLHTASITGEKVTEHQVVEAMQIANRRLKAGIERFVLQGHFAGVPYYELRLEAGTAGKSDLDTLCELLDRALGELNVEYAAKRKSGRLGAIRAQTLAPGTLQAEEHARITARRGRAEQYKHQYLMTTIVED